MSKAAFFPFETWDNNWQVGIFFEGDPFIQETALYFTSSYNVIPARLLGFTYPEYLRFCQANGAILRGKNGYTHAVWTDKKQCEKICKMIEEEWKKVLANVQFYDVQPEYERVKEIEL